MRNKIKIVAILTVMLLVIISLSGCDNGIDSGAEKSTDIVTSDEGITTKGTVETRSEDKYKDDKNENAEQIKKTPNNGKKSSKSSSEPSETKNKKKVNDDVKKSSNNVKVSISIDCKTLLKKDADLANKVSNDGIILSKKTITLKKEATVLDALKKTKINYVGSNYITGINGLSEKDAGKLSGWIYLINGRVPMESCDEYKLENGDTIQWRYSCESGSDL